ncbi:hypothetical protein PISMIDRAFT_12127 [Pisolithus microcarpus 441]|uniref:Uncharacterized protein n=1 Tax=Pisolithus microcarpus 441 TaxID=765257 RepID=A0A0C9YXW4_9AGAM|nr:hypothetical protein PISMIDRAFT_12127 [Pisolithus microcarpus 441]
MGWRSVTISFLFPRPHQLISNAAVLPIPTPRRRTVRDDKSTFINRRLTLPSIAHRVTTIRLLGAGPLIPSYTYEIRASGLRPLEIALPDKLEDAAMKQGALQLVRPWHSKLLSPSAESDATTEKQLFSTLERPFHALLLIQLPHNEYKRIVSSTLIIAEPVDSSSVLQSKVRTLNIV